MNIKNLLLVMVLFLGSVTQNAFAQDYKPSANFYGIDYSLCKVIGAYETENQFRNAFIGINDLFVKEPDKYNLSKSLNMNVCQQDVAPALQSVKKMDVESTLEMTGCNREEIPQEQLQKLISSYSFPEKEGTGILMVANILNKPAHEASYYLCFFDLGTKEIFRVSEGTGKAKGFGLRNYWAGSVYSFLKGQKKNFK